MCLQGGKIRSFLIGLGLGLLASLLLPGCFLQAVLGGILVFIGLALCRDG